MRLRRLTSLASMISLIAPAACSREAPIGTSPRITTTSASRSTPQASSSMRNRIVRPQHDVGAALIHQRIGPERCRDFGAARFAHQRDVIDVGRAVQPLVGARQGRCTFCQIERHVRDKPGLKRLRKFGEARRGRRPVVERRLQGRRHRACRGTARKIARNDDQAPVAAVLERSKFHGRLFRLAPVRIEALVQAVPAIRRSRAAASAALRHTASRAGGSASRT